MAMSDTMRAAVIAAVLLAGSCAAPTNENATLVSDPDFNHPIVVEPASKSVRIAYSPADAGLMPEDAARFDEFVAAYLEGGNGAISVTVPSGAGAQQTIQYFGERLASAGVPRARIMVGMRNDGDPRVELGYVSYTAHTDACGNWSHNANDTASNLPMPDFGCSVQHNMAAQVEDPRDFNHPRAMGEVDAVRRGVVLGKYEKGTITQADKNKLDKVNEQSGSESDVGH
jgi:pilus assembly protein CpaD